jgi:hypothetical protein
MSRVAQLSMPLAVLMTLLMTLLIVSACGKSSGPSTSPTPVGPTTETLSGTTRQTAQGSCSGDSHNFSAVDGDVSVRLLETSDPAGALSVQVCANGIDNRDCTINQQRIVVGQTLSGARKGASFQNLKLLPNNCLAGGPFDPNVGITYRVSLTYMH